MIEESSDFELKIDLAKQLLKSSVKPEYIPIWLATPLEALDGASPIEAIKNGREKEVWRCIYYLGSGIPI